MFPSNTLKGTNFPNMAGQKDCDKWIERELLEAGITISSGYENWYMPKKPLESHGFYIVSKWEDYISKYQTKSEVPYHIIGKLCDFVFIRAWYYYMVSCKVPLEVAKKIYDEPIGKRDIRVVGHCGCPPPEEWVKNGFINSYHIDSQEGLNLFVKIIKEEVLK